MGERSYFVTTTTIGTHPEPIPPDALLSSDEFQRFGIPQQRISQFLASVPPAVRVATSDDLARAYGLNVTEAWQQLDADELTQLRQRFEDASRAATSNVARALLMLDALRTWKAEAQNYEDAAGGRVPSVPCSASITAHGLRMDHACDRLRVVEEHIQKIEPPLRVAAAAVIDVPFSPIQRFVRTLGAAPKGVPSNEWSEAEIAAELLPDKFRHIEAARSRVVIAGQEKPLEMLDAPKTWWEKNKIAGWGIIMAVSLTILGIILTHWLNAKMQ